MTIFSAATVRRLMTIYLCTIAIIGCSRTFVDNSDLEPIQYIDSAVVSKDHPAIINMVKRANQIANIEWTPLKPIPNRNGSYQQGVRQKGIPYSSVKEKDKFIGQEVSFHTFMTAVNNPHSVLYTERVNELPYKGVNCGAYYGTVCSMAVNYALGIEVPYGSHSYANLPDFRKVKNQTPDGLYEGDVLWSPGHVVLVLDIQRDSFNKILEIQILESAGYTFIMKYSLTSFQERWDQVGWISYRYLNLASIEYTPLPFIIQVGDNTADFHYNNDICTSRGDKACYLEGEEIVINVLNDSYSNIELYRDDKLYSSSTVDDNSISYNNLPYGMYKARLTNSTCSSDYTCFEILNVEVAIQNNIVLFNSKNGLADYLVICIENGGRRDIITLTEEMKLSNQIRIRPLKDDEYIKLFFKGQYGRVSNAPISKN